MTEYYEIILRGHLDAHWESWFEGLSLSPTERGDTKIAGQFSDQAALHGVLECIRDLGLTLISVQRFPNRTEDDRGQAGS